MFKEQRTWGLRRLRYGQQLYHRGLNGGWNIIRTDRISLRVHARFACDTESSAGNVQDFLGAASVCVRFDFDGVNQDQAVVLDGVNIRFSARARVHRHRESSADEVASRIDIDDVSL